MPPIDGVSTALDFGELSPISVQIISEEMESIEQTEYR